MRDEILKILEMSKKGTISDDQAAELITALKAEADAEAEGSAGGTRAFRSQTMDAQTQEASRAMLEEPGVAGPGETAFAAGAEEAVFTAGAEDTEKTSKSGKRKKGTHFQFNSGELDLNNLGDMLSGLVNNAINKSFNFGGAKVKIRSTGGDDNRIHSSNVQMPTGEDFDFTDNDINLSQISGLELSHSAFVTDNSIQASTIRGLKIEHGEFTDSQINGSSIEDMEIDGSEWSDISVNGSKLQSLKLAKDTELSDLQFHGCHFKNLSFEKCDLSDMQFHGCKGTQVRLVNCDWSDVAMMGTHFGDAHFENVKMSDGKMEGLRFFNCTIKNVDLSDFALSKVDFTGQEIDGEKELDAFLRRQS